MAILKARNCGLTIRMIITLTTYKSWDDPPSSGPPNFFLGELLFSSTPWKTNMEDKKGGLEDDLPFQFGWFLGSRGVTKKIASNELQPGHPKKNWDQAKQTWSRCVWQRKASTTGNWPWELHSALDAKKQRLGCTVVQGWFTLGFFVFCC